MNMHLEKKLISNKRKIFANKIENQFTNITIKGFLDVEYTETLMESILSKLDEIKEVCSFDYNEFTFIIEDAIGYLTEELPFINGIGDTIVIFHEQDDDIGALKVETPLCELNVKDLIALSGFYSMGSLIIASLDGIKGICLWCSEYDMSFYKWS